MLMMKRKSTFGTVNSLLNENHPDRGKVSAKKREAQSLKQILSVFLARTNDIFTKLKTPQLEEEVQNMSETQV